MPKSMARQKRSSSVHTEDRVMERVVEIAAWMEHHRRASLIGFLALAAAVVAAYFYIDYRSKLMETASARLQEIRLVASGADLEAVRGELRTYIEQFGRTPYGGEARLALADLELRRDSLASAIRVLEPVADLRSGLPTAVAAAGMIAAAYEQDGKADRALEWWRRIEDAARFAYQRHAAMAERARILTAQGRYDEAIALYETLSAQTAGEEGAERFYRVRLGEVLALNQSGASPPSLTDPRVPGGSEGEGEGAELPATPTNGEGGP